MTSQKNHPVFLSVRKEVKRLSQISDTPDFSKWLNRFFLTNDPMLTGWSILLATPKFGLVPESLQSRVDT